MAAMKLAFIFFTLFSLLGAYHARHLHVKTAEVIQMVTGEDEPQPPPLPVEGRPSPRGPRPGGETIYGGDNPKSLPSQGQIVYEGDSLEGRPSRRRPPPSDGQTIYREDNPKAPLTPRVEPEQEQTGYGRDNPNAPPPPKVAPSRGQTTYGGAEVAKKRLADFLALLLLPNDETVYDRDYLNAQPSPQGPGSDQEGAPAGEGVYGRDNPKAPLPPKVAPSRGQTTYGGAGVTKKRLTDFLDLLIPSYDETVYGRDYLNAQPSRKGAGGEGEEVLGQDNLKAPPSPLVDISMDRPTYGRDDPRTPQFLDLNEGHQGMHGRVDPIRSVLFESTSTFDGRRN